MENSARPARPRARARGDAAVEQFRELARTDDTTKRPDNYRARLGDAERAADALRTHLRSPAPDRTALDAAFKQTVQTCTACHKAFRNEKK